MKKLKENLGLTLYVLIMIILSLLMFWAINKKEGFHEDEIFSYGASNSTFSNTFLAFAQSDNIDLIMKDTNPIKTVKNLIYYRVLHPEKYLEKENEIGNLETEPIWRTSAEATEYLQIDNINEALDFFTVYWNTGKDVHPPLFYFVVHIVSILFFSHFSKYIIFIINLVFYIGTLILLRKIFCVLNKKDLSLPNLILYGASIGAISTVMFQRMYMMLTFFVIYLLYINLKIYVNDFNLDKRLKIELCIITVLGFLTQYHFCFYTAFLVLCMILLMIKRKEKKKIITYFLQFVRAAIIGVILFLPCIYHIFFSYRGVNGVARNFTIFESFISFVKNTYLAFSLSIMAGIIFTIVICIIFAFKLLKTPNSFNKDIYFILILPIIIFFIFIIVSSPYRSVRYVMCILPIISIFVVYFIYILINI